MKKLITFLFLLFCSLASFPQGSSVVSNYDLNKKRLLLQVCSMYLYNSAQGTIDVDSTNVLASTAYKLPITLSYDEGYNDGKTFIGKDLMEQGRIEEVKTLLSRSKGDERIILLVQLGSSYLFKPGTKREDIQNAFIYINEAVSLSSRIKNKKWQMLSLMLLGKYYGQINSLELSAKNFDAVINSSRKDSNKKQLAMALEGKAVYMHPLDPAKEKLLIEAEGLYKELGYEEKRLETKMRIIAILFWHRNIKLAGKESYKVLADMRKIGFQHQQFNETTISYIENLHYNLKPAFYYAIKSVKRMERTKDYTFADVFYHRLGVAYHNLRHYDEALRYFEKSIEFGQNNVSNGSWYKSFMDAVIAMTLIKREKQALEFINSVSSKYPPASELDKMNLYKGTALCYWGLKNYTETERYFIKMAISAEKITAPEAYQDLLTAYSAVAAFYAEQGNAAKGKFYTDKVILLGKMHNKRPSTEYFFIALYKTDSLNGNFESALKHHESYKKLVDSINMASTKNIIEELRIQYETVNKEQKIKMMNERASLQESKLEKSRLRMNLAVGGLILLLIIIALLYSRYRLKQRTNIVLEQKEKEISKVNINLRKLLDEKEWLVREIHHRVKNNLQTVISLLNSQSAYLDNDMALSAIKNSQHRIHSMSLIHQKLYSTENISTINMPAYIKELAEYLKASFSLGQRVRFELKIDSIELDVANAVPIGLILNESITNSIKYAFPDENKGIISISLVRTSDKRIKLEIIDDGIGFDADTTGKKMDSFGMILIRGLSEDLGADFEMISNKGTSIKIEFSDEFPIL